MRHTRLTLLLLSLAACAPDGPEGPGGEQGPPGDTGPLGEDGDDGPEGVDGGDARIIDTDTTWSAVETVERIVYVAPGATLTLSPGTEVRFLPEAGLLVDGVLVADGSPTSPIVFRSASSFDESLLGVKIGASSGVPVLDNVRFEGVDLEVRGDGLDLLSWAEFDEAGLHVRGRTTAFEVTHASFTWSGPIGISVEAVDVPSLTLSDLDVLGGEVGVHVSGPEALTVEISDSTLSGAVDGIVIRSNPALGSEATLDTVSLSDMARYGVSLLDTRLLATALTVERVGEDGVAVGALGAIGQSVVSDLTVSDAGRSCASFGGELSLSVASVTGCGNFGIHSGAVGSTVADVVVDAVKGSGIALKSGTIERCRITGSPLGISFQETTEVSRIEACDLTGGRIWVTGGSNATAPVEVVGNNVVMSTTWALEGVGDVHGNHIADNNGQTGADTTVAGTVDGVYDTQTPQARKLDAISDPQSTPVAGTGPAAR